MQNAVLGTDFSIEAFAVDSATGNLTITFKALKAYDGTFRLYLDSSGQAANAGTNAIEKVIKVTERPTGTSEIVKTKSGGTAPVSTSHSGTATINTGEKITFKIPSDNFVWNDGSSKDASSLKDISWFRLNGARIGNDFSAAITTPAGSADVTVEFTALKAGTFNSLNLSMYGGGGEFTTASAPLNLTVKDTGEGSIITGIASGSMLGGQYSGALLNGKTITYADLGNLDIKPGDEIIMPLTAGFFTWDGTAPYEGSPVTTSQLRRGKIRVGVASIKGSNLLESGSPKIVTRGNGAAVSVKFNKNVVTTKDIDFSCTIFLSIDRTRHNDSRVEIFGILSPDVFYVNEHDTYFDISDGSVVEAEEFVRNAELYLGDGVSVHTNLYEGKKYSGIATDEISPSDEDNLQKFPSIDRIITIKSSTLNRPNTKVTMDTDGVNYYVYGAEGNYLGRSNGSLPYSHKYYLSTQEINMNEDIIIDIDVNGEIEEPDGEYIYDPVAGDQVPENVNQNPGTGR